MDGGQEIANDHIPLAFLLGSRAKHYAPHRAAPQTSSKLGSSSSASSYSSASGSRSHRVSTPPLQPPRQRQQKREELFAPEKHPREREEEARRVLHQALQARQNGSTDNTLGLQRINTSNGSISGASPAPVTLSPMVVLRENKQQVVHHVLEMRRFEHDEDSGELCGHSDNVEPLHRRSLAPGYAGDEDEDDARMTSFHGFEQTCQQRAFLDISGSASRIPLLSSVTAKAIHRSTLRKQSQVRARRVDEMHSILQSQQQHTKQQLASLSHLRAHSQVVARVDIGMHDSDDEHDEGGEHGKIQEDQAPVEPTTANALAAVREQHRQEQRLLHERVQEKKQLEQLTREQKLAFHQQQKRALGRVKGVKRPSFLATLQLDSSTATADSAAGALSGDAGARALFGGESFVREKRELRVSQQQQQQQASHKTKNQEESHLERESESAKLKQLQRDKFLQSEGSGLHFGGGFKSASSHNDKKMSALVSSASQSSGDGASGAASRELQQLLECGAMVTTQRKRQES